jgi:hypothetical protein
LSARLLARAAELAANKIAEASRFLNIIVLSMCID